MRRSAKNARIVKSTKIATGGGILLFTILSNLNAVELSTICTNPNNCKITAPQSEVTNHGIFTSSNLIEINASVTHFINYGTITNGLHIPNSSTDYALGTITNYGEMHGVWAYKTQNITINNLGTMKAALGSYFTSNTGVAHFVFEASEGHLTIENFMIPIRESQSEFNNFKGYTDKQNNKNSHFVIWGQGNNFASFKDGNSKIILDFGDGFEFGKTYKINKLITDKSGNSLSILDMDFWRLTTRSSLYKLTQSGDNFIVSLDAPNSEMGILHKANIRTMNNFYTLSNSMIYPRKSYYSQNLGRTHSLLQHSPSLAEGARGWVKNPSLQADSAISLKSYESFSYRNESINRRIQRQNKRNYSRTKRNNNSVILSESEESQKKNNRDSSPKAQNDNVRQSQNQTQNLKENQRDSQNLAQTQTFSQNLSQNPHNYYFILTPFVNHNLFFESGRYNLSGLEYGFLTAFSGKLTPSNSLGAHFIFSYGNLGDSKDKDLSIKSLNLNVGINYKLDLIYDMYLKARGDFFYFLNTLDSLTIKNIKPNNLGFGVSVAYGKDFNFGKGGILGIEAGIDYKALQSSTISLQNNATKTISETYKKSLYNLIYVDLGMNYSKYFGNFGLNATLGIKGNITANKLATSKIHISTFNKSVDMVLDNDNFLGYANLGVSYVMNTKNFDMEFSLAYYGNYGDRVMSNGGGVEWRVWW